MNKRLRYLSILACLLLFGTNLKAQLRQGAELVMNKELNGELYTQLQEFTVNKKLTSLIISITANAESGTISFTLYPPKGSARTYQVDVNSNLEFNETINLKKLPENIGIWKIMIDSRNAIGSYKVTMRTSPI